MLVLLLGLFFLVVTIVGIVVVLAVKVYALLLDAVSFVMFLVALVELEAAILLQRHRWLKFVSS
jgi:hypothetical protein